VKRISRLAKASFVPSKNGQPLREQSEAFFPESRKEAQAILENNYAVSRSDPDRLLSQEANPTYLKFCVEEPGEKHIVSSWPHLPGPSQFL
jgi:hypothetical protein